jgi:hypothetical protein
MKPSILRAFGSLLILSAALGGVNVLADAIDVNWTGAAVPVFQGSGYWNTAANWSDGVVPNNSGSTTYNVTLPSTLPIGNVKYQVGIDVNTTIDNLTVDPNAFLYFGSSTFGTPPGSLSVTGNVYVTGPGATFFGGFPAAQIAGTVYNQGDVLLAFTASGYVQSGANSYGQIDANSDANTNASVSGGQFVLFYGS